MISLYIYDNVNREHDSISHYDSISEMLQDLADHLYYDAADRNIGRYMYKVIHIDVRSDC